MKMIRKTAFFLLTLVLIVSMTTASVEACTSSLKTRKVLSYSVSETLQQELQRVYNRYNFSLGWGLYDISGVSTREVASYHADTLFQSNCTIKAAMLLYVCKKMDSGALSLDTPMQVNLGQLHYDDFGARSGSYTVEYLLRRMIHVSNNTCYEVFLRYFTREAFNAFLAGLGSGTVVKSYNYMGDCTVRNRAVEWRALYDYCHSLARHASHAWKLLCEARYSPIRDGIGRAAAHKSGWHWESGVYGTAGDCAVVSTPNGGCYLMIMFTRNNSRGKYSQALMRELAVTLDKVWDEYYASIPLIARPRHYAAF